MDINILRQFRHAISDCVLRAKDALFNTVDALMTETQAKSFPEVSQSLWFERKWPSLYEAIEDGHIDEKRLREIFAHHLPKPDAGKWQWIGIDASSIARPDAVTSADRTAQPVHNLPACKKPITFGWQFSTVVALPETPSSWTYILDQQRVASETTAIEVAYDQLVPLIPHLPANTIVILDRGYDATWLWCRCSTLGVLGRLKSNRCSPGRLQPQQESEELHAKMVPNGNPTIRPPMASLMAPLSAGMAKIVPWKSVGGRSVTMVMTL